MQFGIDQANSSSIDEISQVVGKGVLKLQGTIKWQLVRVAGIEGRYFRAAPRRAGERLLGAPFDSQEHYLYEVCFCESNGGGEGSRTPVRRHSVQQIYMCSRLF